MVCEDASFAWQDCTSYQGAHLVGRFHVSAWNVFKRLIGSARRGVGVALVWGVVWACSAETLPGRLPREAWGGSLVNVSRQGPEWIIAGRKHVVALNESNLALRVAAGPVVWCTMPSTTNEMIVKWSGIERSLGLRAAKRIEVAPYDTGAMTGVKITLSDWELDGVTIRLKLHLTICLEGPEEELVFGAAAEEHDAVVRQLDWPPPFDARDVEYTILSNGRGNLLPRSWPQEYHPMRRIRNGRIDTADRTILQSHCIEAWSMSWWGFQKSNSAMMVIVETPADAAYRFEHPAGGPTVIGPRWRAALGRFGYMRTARMCFFEKGNYVTLAKRYRRYAIETGLFVSLKEKIARTPALSNIIGVPQTRVSILRNIKPESDRYDRANPSNNYSLVTFEKRAEQLRELKAQGWDRVLVILSGWPHHGYDHQHPDPLPPPEEAGGWVGMAGFAKTCRELGYPFILHDQYRDYYVDAPSYSSQFAIHEEDESLPPKIAFGTRFGDVKEGRIPFMWHWDGGKQAYLNARFQPAHLRKNYRLLFDRGIRPNGIYIDVVGYVPPDEDFNPEHPTTRAESMQYMAQLFAWSRYNLGITATEAGSDWVIPFVDCVNQSGGVGKCIPVPLYNLVYHDAVLISYGAGRSGGLRNLLLGLLCGGVPELPISGASGETLTLLRKMCALNKRLALVEMTDHEFLDPARQIERTTFADGTTVTVNWQANTVEISPDL